MMKRKILAVTIPVVGCITVVGAGFSAWYFSDDITAGGNGKTVISVAVTDEVKASTGNLTVDPTGTNLGSALILDQGGAGNYNVDSGIMFGATDATETTVNENAIWHFTVTFTGSQTLTLDKIYDAGLQVRVVADITLGGNLKNYVEFKNGLSLTVSPDSDGATVSMDKNADGTKLEGEYVVTDANAGPVQDATWTFEMTAKTTKNVDKNVINYSNELLQYKPSSGKQGVTEENSTGKPNATDEPAKMETALTGANITFNVTAYIEDNPDK